MSMYSESPGPKAASTNFHEVSWPYLLGNFCAQLEDLDNVCVSFIGTQPPASFKLSDIRKWFGSVPTYAADGVTSQFHPVSCLYLSVFTFLLSLTLDEDLW